MGLRRLTLQSLGAIGIATAQRVGTPTDDLSNLSVDELFQIQVTSVDHKAQQLSKAPAAVFVLTAEDIRRSGATSIREALQWVPGLTVLSVDGRSWTISARGSASLYANKMLVLIDGRSLYTPLFSGVIWDSIDVPLEDIEQIEVVRGPGAVMWGPNAVNLLPSYSYLNETFWLPGGQPMHLWEFQSASARHQGLLRSEHDISRKLQLDLMLRARSRNVAFNLPGVVLADARLGWRPWRDTQFSFSIKNLAGRDVLETYSETAFVAIPLRRTFVFKWTQRF